MSLKKLCCGYAKLKKCHVRTLSHTSAFTPKLMKEALEKSALRLGIPDPLLNPSARPLLDREGGALLRPSPLTEADGGCQGEARLEVERAEVIEPDWAAAGGLDICLANAIATHC